jgi:hypothetical protein
MELTNTQPNEMSIKGRDSVIDEIHEAKVRKGEYSGWGRTPWSSKHLRTI